MDASLDITKMKVADLKNELKLRNLATTGKRPELLERLQQAIAEGVERENDEDIDEEHLLAGGDEEGEEDAFTPIEEAPVAKTPARASRRSIAAVSTPAAATPKTPARRLALKRTPAAALKVPEEPEEVQETPAKDPTPAKKTPAKEPAVGTPPAKIAKIGTPKAAESKEEEEENKENGEPQEKTALEKRAERFGVVSADVAKSKRAERFGIVSEDSAKAKRAERFGIVKEEKLLKKGKMVAEPVDLEKIKARAERFGTTTASALDAEKKKSRAERFADKTVTNGKDVTSDEAKAARAAKFAAEETKTEEAAPTVSKSGKTLITFGSEDATKQARAARFAAST